MDGPLTSEMGIVLSAVAFLNEIPNTSEDKFGNMYPGIYADGDRIKNRGVVRRASGSH
jgi:hypothetical protein